SSKLKFVYRVSAAYSAKGVRFDPDTNVYNFNPYSPIPTPNSKEERISRPKSGQDAFFVSRIGDIGDVALGVVWILITIFKGRNMLTQFSIQADGVGGWVDSGIDP